MTVVVGDTCTACGACLATCPERALVPAPRRPAVRDRLCTDCLACLEVCPAGAIAPVPGLGPAAPPIAPVAELDPAAPPIAPMAELDAAVGRRSGR